MASNPWELLFPALKVKKAKADISLVSSNHTSWDFPKNITLISASLLSVPKAFKCEAEARCLNCFPQFLSIHFILWQQCIATANQGSEFLKSFWEWAVVLHWGMFNKQALLGFSTKFRRGNITISVISKWLFPNYFPFSTTAFSPHMFLSLSPQIGGS